MSFGLRVGLLPGLWLGLWLGLWPWDGALSHAAPPATPAAASECARDRDCALMDDGCCGCSAGGAQRAVPRKQLAQKLREQQARCGATTACLAVMSTHPSCFSEPRCQKGRCALIPREGAATSLSARPEPPQVRSAKDVEALAHQMVRVSGKYVLVDVRMRQTPPPVHRGHAAIELADGTLVYLHATWQHEAIRPADERKRFAGQPVSAVGLLLKRAPADPRGANSIISPCLIDIQAITAQ